MLGEDDQKGQRKLTPDELEDARNALGCMVPWRFVAAQYKITENDLRRQLNMPPRRAPEPPAGEGGLIRPEHIEQMSRRKSMLKSLREKSEGRGDG